MGTEVNDQMEFSLICKVLGFIFEEYPHVLWTTYLQIKIYLEDKKTCPACVWKIDLNEKWQRLKWLHEFLCFLQPRKGFGATKFRVGVDGEKSLSLTKWEARVSQSRRVVSHTFVDPSATSPAHTSLSPPNSWTYYRFLLLMYPHSI